MSGMVGRNWVSWVLRELRKKVEQGWGVIVIEKVASAVAGFGCGCV